MGLYDDRLAALSESRSRVAARRLRRIEPEASGKRTKSAKSSKVKKDKPMAKSRRKRSHKKKASKRARRSRPRRSHRRRKVHAAAVATPRRRRRRKVAVAAAPARRRARRARASATVATPRRRRARVSAWHGHKKAHRRAAKKGWAKRRRKKMHETAVASPRRRRRAVRANRRRSSVSAPRRSRRMYASSGGMSAGNLAMAAFTGTVGFLAADALDRFMATYNPAGTEAPKDKFTSSGTGMLANTMNIAATPNWKRIAVGVAAPVVPAVGAAFVKNKTAKVALEGLALGAGISTLKMLFTTLVIGRLLKPKDTSASALQSSKLARLYPAEISARINIEQKMQALSASGAGALSGADDRQRPTAAQAMAGTAEMPTAQDALRTGLRDMPTAAQAMAGTGEGWQPGPPPGPGPGPQPNDASCGCADAPTPGIRYSAFLSGEAAAE